jgi:hypothetical protein
VSHCQRCSTPMGCAKHGLFRCKSCGKLTRWSDGADDDRPNDCSDCWQRWWSAMEIIAVGLYAAIGVAALEADTSPQ